jgi:hypothetical protein
LREIDKGKARDRCFIAASREFESAYEQIVGNHGVLTAALLDGLNPTHRDVVNNHTLVNFVEQRLKGEIQRPVFHNSGGEIILTATESARVPKPKDTLKSISEIWPDFDLDNYNNGKKSPRKLLALPANIPKRVSW